MWVTETLLAQTFHLSKQQQTNIISETGHTLQDKIEFCTPLSEQLEAADTFTWLIVH